MNSRIMAGALFLLLVTVATAIAAGGNVCKQTSQAGLNSCKQSAQSDYWNAVGTCDNVTEKQARQVCLQTAQSNYQADLSSCHDQFVARNQVCQKVGSAAYDAAIDPANFTTTIDNPMMPLKAGTTYVYEGPTSQGYQMNTVAVTTNTKLLMASPPSRFTIRSISTALLRKTHSTGTPRICRGMSGISAKIPTN